SEILAIPRREYPHFAAGLMFMHHLSAEQAAERLRERGISLAAKAEKLRGIMAQLRADGVSRLSLVELEHKIAMLDFERKWVNGLEKEIADGKLEWKVGIH